MSVIIPNCQLCMKIFNSLELKVPLTTLEGKKIVCMECRSLYCDNCTSSIAQYNIQHRQNEVILAVCPGCLGKFCKKGSKWDVLSTIKRNIPRRQQFSQ